MKINFQINGKKTDIIDSDYFYIAGWFIWEGEKNFEASIGETKANLCPVIRKDLDSEKTYAFVVYGNTSDFFRADRKKELLRVCDKRQGKVVAETVIVLNYSDSRAAKVRSSQEQKRNVIKEMLSDDVFTISENKALDFISGSGEHDPSLGVKTDGISAHPYHRKLLELVKDMPHEGMALDVGCGCKMNFNDRIVGLEIFDYPNVDVLAFAQTIPFKSNSFDVVYSNAVLEHVDDPFLCAKEMVRVLKPGGVLMSCVPFLQAEHGYPHHYFNATRAGHAKLFEGEVDIVNQYVGDASQPWYIVMRSLMLYRSFLPTSELKEQFGHLTINDILGMSYKQWQGHDLIAQFPEDKKWVLAGATTLIGKKKGG